jgi:hypothetical protein
VSSAVYLSFKKSVPLKEWHKFCPKYDIVYSPNTIGQNTFYYAGHGGVQIKFGESNFEDLPMIGDMVNFSKATPFPEASEIVVSSFIGENLDKIAFISKKILEKWEGTFICDDELTIHLVKSK